MQTKVSALAVLTLTLSACVSLQPTNEVVTADKEVYNLQQAIKNIALEPKQTRLTLVNPEDLNQDSVVVAGDYSVLVTESTSQRFDGQKVYAKDYSVKYWVNDNVFRQREGQLFYTVDDYRLVGSKSTTTDTETVLTKLYKVPKVSKAGSRGKMGTGYMEVVLSKEDNRIGVAKAVMDWSLTKIDHQKAQFCEIFTAYYDVEQFGIDTADTTTDCYLINQQGDILGFESDMTIAPKNNTPELRFITE